MPAQYRYSKLDQSLLPTIDDVKSVLKKADASDPKIRDQRQLMSLLMRMQEANPRLAGNIQTRRTALQSFSSSVVAVENSDTERALQAFNRCRKLIQKLRGWHIDNALYGVSLSELKWNVTPNGTAPIISRRYLPYELERTSSIEMSVVESDGQKMTNRTAASELIERNPQSFIYNMDESFSSGGILRTLIYKSIILNEMEQEWANTAKKIKGIIEAIYSDNASNAEISNATTAASQLVRNNVTVHSDAIQFAFQDIVSSQAVGTFRDMISMLYDLFAIAILGQSNTTQLPNSGGSRAALEILKLISADITYSDIITHEAVINEQVLLYDYQLNYDLNATECPWTYSVIVPEENDLESRARTIQTLLDSGLELLTDEVYSIVGFRKPENAPPTITRATPNVSLGAVV